MKKKSIPYNGEYYYSAMEFGYDGNMESDRLRQSPEEKWTYKYNSGITRWPQEFPAEAMLTAQLIYDNTDLPIQVLLSGGYDSLAVVEAFREAEVPFEAISARLKHGYNDHDIKTGIKYCKTHNIKQKIVELDIKDFWDNHLEEYTLPVQNNSPGRAVVNWLIDQCDGLPVLGNTFVCAESFPYSESLIVEHEKYNIPERWLTYRNRPGIPKFFRYTNEIRLAQLIDPTTLNFFRAGPTNDNAVWISTFKHMWYLKNYPHFPKIGETDSIKIHDKNQGQGSYTGFELLYDDALPHYNRINELLGIQFDGWVKKTFKEELYDVINNEHFHKKAEEVMYKLELTVDEINKLDKIHNAIKIL